MRAIRTQARASVERITRARSRWPLVAERRLAQGIPGRHLRRRGLMRPGGVCGSRTPTRLIIDWTDGVPSRTSASTSSSRSRRTAERADVRPPARRPARAPALLPHSPTRRSRASARSRAGAEARRQAPRRRRSSRSASTMPLYDITTGTGDFIANGVVSHNCFARPTHTYLDFNAGRDFEKRDRRQGQRARGAARRSWRGRRGRASTSRWGRTPTRTSGSRAATG